MGWWQSEHGMCGDGPADLCGHFLRDLEKEFIKEVGRLPTQGEVADLIEFCTCGVLRPLFGDANSPLCYDTCHEDGTPRASEAGRQGIEG